MGHPICREGTELIHRLIWIQIPDAKGSGIFFGSSNSALSRTALNSESGRGLPHSKTLREHSNRTNLRRFWSAAVPCRFHARAPLRIPDGGLTRLLLGAWHRGAHALTVFPESRMIRCGPDFTDPISAPLG